MNESPVSLVGCVLVHRLHLFQGIRHRDAHDAHAFIVKIADLFRSRDLDRVGRLGVHGDLAGMTLAVRRDQFRVVS